MCFHLSMMSGIDVCNWIKTGFRIETSKTPTQFNYYITTGARRIAQVAPNLIRLSIESNSAKLAKALPISVMHVARLARQKPQKDFHHAFKNMFNSIPLRSVSGTARGGEQSL